MKDRAEKNHDPKDVPPQGQIYSLLFLFLTTV